jgi:Nuclease subunit of the excinuclease complex
VKNCDSRLKSARDIYNQFIKEVTYSFSDVKPSDLPQKAGVYIIMLKDTKEVLYVGRTRNIRQRIYNNHLMGNKSTARLKKYLVEDNFRHPDIKDYIDAKEYLKEKCIFRYILIENNNERGHIEGLMGYLTNARYIESEH